MEKSFNENERNDILEELLVDMVQNGGEHALCVSDILVSFMNNRLLQEERDEIMEQMDKGSEITIEPGTIIRRGSVLD
jgi:hypothetical protein